MKTSKSQIEDIKRYEMKNIKMNLKFSENNQNIYEKILKYLKKDISLNKYIIGLIEMNLFEKGML